jgi:aminoglycoside 6'-N-acetyltransferase I
MEVVDLKYSFGMEYINKVAMLELELWQHETLSDYIENIWEVLNNTPNYNILLAMDDEGNPLGYLEIDAFFSYDEKYSATPILKLCGLYVTPKARRQGVATHLIKAAEKRAKEMGCHQISSDYYEYNDASARLHALMGFKETSKLINVIKDI